MSHGAPADVHIAVLAARNLLAGGQDVQNLAESLGLSTILEQVCTRSIRSENDGKAFNAH
jgi:hypothetical protein